jgi:hypothetical protein
VGCHSGDSYFEYCYLPEFPKAASHLLKSGGVKQWFDAFMKSASETKARSEDWAALNIVAMAAAYSPKRGEPLNVELPFDIESGEILPAVWQRWLKRDPVRFVPESAAAFKGLQSLFIDCGTRDEFNLRWGARQVARSLERMGAPCVHEEFEDTHGGINYRYDRSLGHLLPRMRKE